LELKPDNAYDNVLICSRRLVCMC